MEIFNIYKPNFLLSPYIQFYWVLKVEKESIIEERVIPFGYIQLFFHRENQMYSNTSQELQPRSFVGGMTTNYNDLSSDKRIDMFVIAFRPEGARAFLDIPLRLFRNNHISVDDLEDPLLKELGIQIRNEPDDKVCIQLIEKAFLKKLSVLDSYNIKRLVPAINYINKNSDITISNLANLSFLSHKQFNRVFTDYVGSTPKEFQRIIRFQRTLFILENNPTINLVHLAAEAGYYDQPHLIKEFKHFSGYTPLEYIARFTPHSDYFVNLKEDY